jgi:hypothetical protein
MVGVRLAAELTGVRPGTVRAWARRYQLTVACDVNSHALLYDVAELLAAERATRRAGGSRDPSIATSLDAELAIM